MLKMLSIFLFKCSCYATHGAILAVMLIEILQRKPESSGESTRIVNIGAPIAQSH